MLRIRLNAGPDVTSAVNVPIECKTVRSACGIHRGLTHMTPREIGQSGIRGLVVNNDAGAQKASPIRLDQRGVGKARPSTPHIPSTLLLTRMFTATRRFCALPSGVLLSAKGSALAIPVGVSIR